MTKASQMTLSLSVGRGKNITYTESGNKIWVSMSDIRNILNDSFCKGNKGGDLYPIELAFYSLIARKTPENKDKTEHIINVLNSQFEMGFENSSSQIKHVNDTIESLIAKEKEVSKCKRAISSKVDILQQLDTKIVDATVNEENKLLIMEDQKKKSEMLVEVYRLKMKEDVLLNELSDQLKIATNKKEVFKKIANELFTAVCVLNDKITKIKDKKRTEILVSSTTFFEIINPNNKRKKSK